MNPLLEAILNGGLLLDAAGVIGLGLIGLAAIRLASHDRSWGGNLMAIGAIGLLLARLIILAMPILEPTDFFQMLGDQVPRIVGALPPFLLTLGLAGVVWGIWSHERGFRETE